MRIQHLIDGKPVDSRATFETINPATQEVLAEVADGGAAGGQRRGRRREGRVSRLGRARPPANAPR